MEITRANLKLFRTKFAEAVKGLEEEFDVIIEMKNISYNDEGFNTKLEVSNPPEDGKSLAQATFEEYAHLFDLTPSDFGRQFLHGGTAFTITKLKPNNSKYPIIGTNARGTSYKFTAESVVKNLV